MVFPSLGFKKYTFKIKEEGGKTYIFDAVRKKFVVLQPEEWVRQHVVSFLIQDRLFPEVLINVEKQIKIGRIIKRYDVVVYTPNGDVLLVVECKAPDVSISQKSFNQIARYNMVLKSKFLMLTNGLQNHIFKSNIKKGEYIFLEDLPCYNALLD